MPGRSRRTGHLRTERPGNRCSSGREPPLVSCLRCSATHGPDGAPFARDVVPAGLRVPGRVAGRLVGPGATAPGVGTGVSSIASVSVLPAQLRRAAVSPSTVSRVALANVVANGLIVVTGGAVRLTGSGLGCPTWPRCTDASFVATPELAGHGAIEFGNRLLTFLLAATAIATVLVVFRSTRRDLRTLAVLGFLGIPAQALLGGITVLTGLNPWTVAAHFLVSMVLVALTTILWLRSREPGVGRPLVRRPLALL